VAADNGTMIEAVHLTKRYGDTLAVDDLSFQIKPGQVTGFLGPNGAGKTTTMRMILGLDAPSNGSVTINGQAYRDLGAPLTEVGALLDAKALHGGRSARSHLRVLAASNGLPNSRVDEVLRIVGLQDVAKRRTGGFSLGMGQRLGIAAALLGDPGILMFDEPVNGLDPEGILWVRNFMRELATEGRTVLVSSHLMSEMALTADHLLVIGRGRLIAAAGVQEFIDGSGGQSVLVRSADDETLARHLTERGGTVVRTAGGGLDVSGLTSGVVGEIAFHAGIIVSELTPQRASLEEAFMEMTRDSVDYTAGGTTPAAGVDPAAGFDYPQGPGPTSREVSR
jgi:ABC-2 type transport system ATP-binding protein